MIYKTLHRKTEMNSGSHEG